MKSLDIIPVLKENNNIRAKLAVAFLEDDEIRKESRENSLAYLQKREIEDDRTPFWMWSLMWFTVGILFSVSFEALMLPNHQLIIQWIGRLF